MIARLAAVRCANWSPSVSDCLRATILKTMRILPVTLALLAACAEPFARRASSPLLNALPDPGHPAVGAFAGPPGPCTATLVGPRTVLLAAHCLKGTGSSSFTVGGKVYPVAEVRPHPDWHEVTSFPELPSAFAQLIGTFSIHDLGVALLAEEVHAIAPMRLALGKPAIGAPVTLVGLAGGVKQMGEDLVGAIGEEFVLYGTKGGMKGTNVLTCMGDSGGPTLIVEEGEERVLGVHSMSNCASYKPGGAAYVQDTRVATHLDWLKTQADDLAHPREGRTSDLAPPRDLGGVDVVRGDGSSPPLTDPGCSVGAVHVRGPGAALVLPLLVLGLRLRRRGRR